MFVSSEDDFSGFYCESSPIVTFTPPRNIPIFGSQRVHPNSKVPYSDALKFMGAKKEAFVYHNGHVKRPMNAFMVWSQMERQIIQNEILTSSPKSPRVIHNSEISCQLGKLWARLSDQERKPYVEEAERMRVLHKKQFPYYKYRPRKNFKIRSRQEDLDTDDDAGQVKSKQRQSTPQSKCSKKLVLEKSKQNYQRDQKDLRTHDFETSFCSFEKTKKDNIERCEVIDSPQRGSVKKRGRKVFSAVLSSTGALSKFKVFEIIRQNCSTLERCKNMNQDASDEDALGDDMPLKRHLTLKIRINEKQETRPSECVAITDKCNVTVIESPTLPDDVEFGFSPSKPVGTESFLYCGGHQHIQEATLLQENQSFDQYSDGSFESSFLDETFANSDIADQFQQTSIPIFTPDYQITEKTNNFFNNYDTSCDLTSNTNNTTFKNFLSEDLEAIEFPAWWKSELSEIDVSRLMQDVQDFDDFPICASREDVTVEQPDPMMWNLETLDGFRVRDLLEGCREVFMCQIGAD